MPKAKDKTNSGLQELEEDLQSIEGSEPRPKPGPPPGFESLLERMLVQQQSHSADLLRAFQEGNETLVTVIREAVAPVERPPPTHTNAGGSNQPDGLFSCEEAPQESHIDEDSDDEVDFLGWDFPSAAQPIHQEVDDPLPPSGPSTRPDQVNYSCVWLFFD